jgi:WD40 repeat protein
MESSERYDAFISYRHAGRDRSCANWLHRRLENYRTPRALEAKGVAKRLMRVFRDEEELAASADLSDAIKSELRASRALIVVCSPAAVSSRWINAEVEYFRSLGRGDRILAVLLEGTPETAFPPALRAVHAEQRAVRDDRVASGRDAADGATSRDGEPGAPRFSRGLFAYRERRLTLLRLLAPLLNCRFDDLRRRDEERALRRKRALQAAASCGAVALAIIGWRLELGRIETLTTYSRDNLNRDPARSLLLSQLALQRTQRLEAITRWFGVPSDDAVRQSLEAAIVQSRLRQQFIMPAEPVQAIAWDQQGRVIAADFDGNVSIWTRASGSLVAHRRFAPGVQRLALRPDNVGGKVAMVTGQMRKFGGITMLTLEGGQRDLHVWDPESNSLRTQPLSRRQHSLYEAALAWCARGKDSWLATAAGNDEAMLWNEGDPSLPQALLIEGKTESTLRSWGTVNALAWNADCTKLAAATSRGLFVTNSPVSEVRLVLRSQGDRVNVSQDEAEGFLAVDWSKDDTKLAVGGQDRTVRIVSTDGSTDQVLSGHQLPVRTVRWSHDGKRLATAGADGVVLVWTVPEYSIQYKVLVGFYTNQGEYVNGLAWSPDGTELATVGDDESVRVWDVSAAAQPVSLLARRGRLTVDRQNRLVLDDQRLSDTELAELARQRTVRPLTSEERAQYVGWWVE